MDTLDTVTLAVLAGYALGYVHANLVRKCETKPICDWMMESATDCARFGLAYMQEMGEIQGEKIDSINLDIVFDKQKVLIEIKKQ